MKINTLNIARLLNSDHVNFMQFTAAATDRFAVIGEKFPTQKQFLARAYDRENQAYLKSNRSFLTKQVQAANELRILRFREVNNTLKAAELCTERGKADAAVFLLSIVRDYGGASKILSLRVDSMSGVLTNLCEDFQERFAAQVSVAGLTECVEELRVANAEYIRLRGDRTEEVSQQEKEEMVRARGESDTCWHGLIDSVNWHYYYFKDADLLPFMKYMNTEIDWYRTILGQKPGDANTNPDGGSEAGDDGENNQPSEPGVPNEPTNPPTTEPGEPNTPGGGTAEPQYSVATFNFYGGRSEELRQLVGSLLHAPQNTEGYHWVPSVPSTMPAVNTSYSEEADGVVKYTVAWYLPNGNPIVWYELAPGEVIPEAPEPPEGYYWHPYPDVMPEHDLDIIPEPIKG